MLRPVAWRGDWDEGVREIRLSVDHPVGKHLWMRRQELARGDFDDATDAESRDASRDFFDSLDVKLLVPILFGVDLLGVIAVSLGAILYVRGGGRLWGGEKREQARERGTNATELEVGFASLLPF